MRIENLQAADIVQGHMAEQPKISLEKALDVWFQPVFRLINKNVEFQEALLRWHAAPSTILPDQFLPTFDKMGHSTQLDRHVIRHVAKILTPRPSLSLSVNLTAATLEDESFPDFMVSELNACGVSSNRVILEFDETVVGTNPDKFISMSHRLRELRVRVALDNIGINCHSLHRISECAIDVYKIDAHFTCHIKKHPIHQIFIKAIRDIANLTSGITVATHIEDEETFFILMGLGITCGQGLHLAAPQAQLFSPMQ